MLIHYGSRQIMRIPPDPDLQNTDALNPVDPDRNCRLSLRKLSGTSCICTLGASFSSFSCRARKKYRYSVYNACSSSFYMDDLVNQLGQGGGLTYGFYDRLEVLRRVSIFHPRNRTYLYCKTFQTALWAQPREQRVRRMRGAQELRDRVPQRNKILTRTQSGSLKIICKNRLVPGTYVPAMPH